MAQRNRKGQKSGSGMKPFYVVLGIVAVLGIAVIAWAATRNRSQMATQPIDMGAITDPEKLYAAAKPIVIGNENAPVKLVAFEDMMCPACAEFSLHVAPELKQKYVDSGQLQIVYYDFPLGGAHVHSFLAARAVRCAGDQGKATDLRQTLFSRQATWSSQRSVADTFVDYAGEIGLDTSAFRSCLESDKYADVVTANRQLGDQLGVNSTPTVIINGKQPANPMDPGQVTEMIDQALGKTG